MQTVELGFTAVASLAQILDGAEPNEGKDGGEALASWKMGCATVANAFSELLLWSFVGAYASLVIETRQRIDVSMKPYNLLQIVTTYEIARMLSRLLIV